jgi:hypothetical protein
VVLELAAEDYFGLWEVAWRLDNVFGAPESSSDTPAGVVASLCDRGLAELYTRERDADEPVPRGAQSFDLTAGSVWDEPKPSGAQSLIGATELGVTVLRDTPES